MSDDSTRKLTDTNQIRADQFDQIQDYWLNGQCRLSLDKGKMQRYVARFQPLSEPNNPLTGCAYANVYTFSPGVSYILVEPVYADTLMDIHWIESA